MKPVDLTRNHIGEHKAFVLDMPRSSVPRRRYWVEFYGLNQVWFCRHLHSNGLVRSQEHRCSRIELSDEGITVIGDREIEEKGEE